MSEANRLTGAFAMFLLVHGVAPGGTPAPQAETRQPPPTVRFIERELVRRLAAGEEVSTLHAELRQRSDTPRRATVDSAGAAAPDARIAGTVERLLAADLLAHYELESVGERLIAGGAPETAIRRWEEAKRVYQERRERLLGPAALDDLGAVLNELAPPSRPILRAGLPYGTANLSPREPVLEPTIVPVYVQLDAPPPSGADHGGVAGDPHAGLTEPILEQARALGHDAVRLFELVQTEIATEWYAGAMKGADGTLRQRAGNDVDQASLLIALLRAGGFAARYVHGVIEVSLEDLARQLDLARPDDVPAALRLAGVAARPLVRGGRVQAMAMEHTWVAALVPYSNYRGAAVDFSGMTWVPLAPALKGYASERGRFVLRELAPGVAERVDQYLSRAQHVDPLAQVQGEVDALLDGEGRGETVDDVLGTRSVDAAPLGLLPSSLPATVLAVTGESATLAPEHVQRIRLRVWPLGTGGAASDQAPLLDAELTLGELLARRVSLSFMPATLEDHQTTLLFGGLLSTPPYLVEARPQLVVAGRREAAGDGSLPMAERARLEVEWLAPGADGAPEITTVELIAGGHYALGFGGQAFEPAVLLDPRDAAAGDIETLAARVLAQRALDYGARVDHAEQLLGSLLGVRVLRPAASLVVASLALEVDSALGLPHGVRVTGVHLDAARRVVEPLAYDGDAGAMNDFLLLAGLVASAQERFQFEEAFGVAAISADLGLGLAREQGVEVLVLDEGNVDARLAELEHPASVRSAVASWARAGLRVEVPRTEIGYQHWVGSVWRVVDQVTGASGHFLHGGIVDLAGGATATPLADWPVGFLADAFEAFGEEPNPDPLSAATISRVEHTDGQRGIVGELLENELAVVVRDEIGRPVLDAEVELAVIQGGGILIGDADGEGSRVVVLTDERGVAAAGLRLGNDTNVNPILIWDDPTNERPSRASAHEIEATVEGADGLLFLDQALVAYALPGEPVAFRRTDLAEQVMTVEPAAWVDTVLFLVEDQHGNPVANVPVIATMEVLEQPPWLEHCLQGFEPEPLPGKAFLFADCAQASLLLARCGDSSLTTSSGAAESAFGVVSGPNLTHGDLLRVEVPALSSEHTWSFTRQWTVFSGPDDPPFEEDCRPAAGYVEREGDIERVLPRLVRVVSPVPVNLQGDSLLAAGPGEALKEPLPIQILALVADVEVVAVDDPESERRFELSATAQRWKPARGELEVQVSGGGRAGAIEYVPAGGDELGHYKAQIFLGPNLGPGEIEIVVDSLEVVVPTLNNKTGIVSLETRQYRDSLLPRLPHAERLAQFHAVRPEIVEIEPQRITLDSEGRSQELVTVRFAVEPTSYLARSVQALLLEDGVAISHALAASRQGGGEVTFQRGLPFDATRRYELQLALNLGSAAEVRSEAVVLPIAQQLLHDVKQSLILSQEVDLLSRRVFPQGDTFEYTLGQDAEVTLAVRSVDAIDPDGTPDLGAPILLLDRVVQPAGEHAFVYGPQDLPPALYRFELQARSLLDDHTESEQGSLEVVFRIRDRAPLGHAVVRGVDLFDGHLIVPREDFAFPGRGPQLAFRRTWSSNHGNEPGPLGVGWAHPWDSRVIVTPYGEAIVVGAEGGGMRFVLDGSGGWRPLLGYHGTLVSNTDDFSFDFYTRSGTRYHYRNTGRTEFPLDFVEDTNGNRLTLSYVELAPSARLSQVRDDSGRALSFTWQQRTFAFWAGWVVTRVDGPGGASLELEYDGLGNLVLARREDGASVESYQYGTLGVQGRHLLVAIRNEVDGSETRYTWGSAGVGVQGDVVVPSFVVEELVLPEGGVTRFGYDRVALAERASGGELSATVLDGRGETTSWVLNGYGSPLRTTDPLGNTTALEWSADDVLMTARTDPNGAVTRYEYDQHGNLTVEETEVSEGGTPRVLRRETTYWPASSFAPPNGGVVKERVASRVDRDDRRIDLEYDERGNLVREVVRVTDVDGLVEVLETSHAYHANGDRASTTDPRGHTTRFGYDSAGNLERVTDALGGERWEFRDGRGRPVARRDQEGRTTRLEYDTLDRVIRTLLPNGAEETAQYDDTTRTRTTFDAEGRVTVTRLDSEARVAEVTNAAGGTKLFEYDAEGAKTRESSWFDGPTPRVDTRFVYDEAGRLVRREEPLGRITTYRYDGNSNLVEAVLLDGLSSDFEPRVTNHEYDELNRVVATSRLLQPGGSGGVATVRYVYDGEGNRVEEVDALGRVGRFRYDELQRQIEQSGPEWREGQDVLTQRLYDGTGNLVEERRRNERLLADGSWESADQARRVRYDVLGRAVERIDAEGHSSTFEYDRVGNLVVEVDARLERTEHRYDMRDRRIETLRHLNRRTVPARTVRSEWVYDRVGNVVEERNANGNLVEHEHDALDRVVRSYDSLGTLTEAEYDARGNRLREIDARGHETVQVFDALDRVVEVRRPEDRIERYGYDVAGNRVSMEDPLGRVTRYEYDRLDRLVTTRLPLVGTGLGGTGPEAEAVESATYDIAGNRRSATDARGHTTTFEYDALDRLVRQVAPAPLLYQSTYRYDAQGNLVEEIDPRGIVERSRYDLEDRRTQLQRDGVVVEAVSYDPSGSRELVTDANGVVTSYVWDERDLLLEEARPLAAVTRYVRDDAGDVVEEIDPEGRVTRRVYDLRRRLVAEENGAGDRTEHGYDGSGNRTLVRRPEGGEWQYRYDDANRLEAVEDPLGAVTSYAYDAADNLVEIVDAAGSSTRYEHDERDRRIAVVRADGTREESAYDAAGNRIARQDPKGQLTEWEYDALGREVSRSYDAPEEPTGDDLERTDTAYDPNGNVVQVDEVYGGGTGTRTTRFGYDSFDRVERVESPEGTLVYGYDAKGNRTRLRDADGGETFTTYDALDRVATVSGPSGAVRSSWFRDSRLREVRHLGGATGDTTATHSYDAAGRIAEITNRQGAALVSSYRYEYDHNGNRLVQEEQNGGEIEVTTYAYDGADRLLEVAYPERLVTYGYDLVGNRLVERVEAVDDGGVSGELLEDKTYRYDERHRVLEIVDAVSGATTAFAWDANGNQRSRSVSEGGGGAATEDFEYLYDARDRLVEIRRDGLLLTTHRYDFRGLRFRKSGPDGVERFLWDGDRLLQERDDALNTAARYEWSGGRLVTMEHAEEGRRSYLFDGLGSVVDLVQPDGTLAARYQWDAWGEERRAVGESANRFGFTGHQREEEAGAGLYYARARFYDAGLGQFLREDPVEGDVVEPDTLHDYVYARGNPTVWVDPSGEVPIVGNLVGGGASVGFGWLVSKITGDEYTWKDAGIDFGLGAATFGLSAVNKVRKLGKVGQAATRVASEATLDIGAEAIRAEVHGEDITLGQLATGAALNFGIGEAGGWVGRRVTGRLPRAREGLDVELPPVRYQVEGVVVREGGGLELNVDLFARRSVQARSAPQDFDLRTSGTGEESRWLTGAQLLEEALPAASSRRTTLPRVLQAQQRLQRRLANSIEGARRELQFEGELRRLYPRASVQREQLLRGCDACGVLDPLTATRRRLDFVVIEDGRVLDVVEVTSEGATKAAQIAKERRVRAAGGTYIRDRDTGLLLDLSAVPTRVVRRE